MGTNQPPPDEARLSQPMAGHDTASQSPASGSDAPDMGSAPVTGPAEAMVEFPDNRLLLALCGPHDRNLVRIEAETGVNILRRGNLLAVLGTPETQADTVAMLEALYLPLRPQQRPHPEQCKDQPDPFHDRAAGDGQASDADDLRHRACQSEQ